MSRNHSINLDISEDFPFVAVSGSLGIFYAGEDARAVGKAFHWAIKNQIETLEIYADASVSSGLARRASFLSLSESVLKDILVYSVSGGQLSVAEQKPIAQPPVMPEAHWNAAKSLAGEGLRVLDANGRVAIEYDGLEVARVVEQDDEVMVQVGVGQADREIHQLLNGGADEKDSLDVVLGRLKPLLADSMHPLNRVALANRLRSRYLAEPGLVNCLTLEPVAPLRPSESIKSDDPIAAVGTDLRGNQVVVVFSVGVDLDLLPEAIDYRQRESPDARLHLVLPARDAKLVSSSAMKPFLSIGEDAVHNANGDISIIPVVF